jgi:hypothetical protein
MLEVTMSQKTRIFIGLVVLAGLVLLIAGVEALRRSSVVPDKSAPSVTLIPGSIPIYLNGQLIAAFSPQDLDKLKKMSFVEPLEGKTQEGRLLRDVLLLYLQPAQLRADTQVIVSSSSRQKSAQLTWAEIDAVDNQVMFDLANRGTLKLASKLERLDTREEWVQDVDKIEVTRP